jgi:hypothetical protein
MKRATLFKTLAYFMKQAGTERVGFLTLTFRRETGVKWAGQCFSRFIRQFRTKWIVHWIKVMEIGNGGCLHIHLVVQCRENIADGTDFNAVEQFLDQSRSNAEATCSKPAERCEQRNKTTTNESLVEIWKCLDRSLIHLGFGWQYDFFPVIDPNKVAGYMSKSFGKSRQCCPKHPRGCKAVDYSRGCPKPEKQPKERSKWFREAVDCLLAACGKSEESYFAQQFVNRRWHHIVITIARCLDGIRTDWKSLSPATLANLMVYHCIRIAWLGGTCNPIFLDLLRVADVSSQKLSEYHEDSTPF